MAFDNICKLLAENYPADFANWLLPQQSQQVKVLKTELSIEPIRADSVILLQTENCILHLEFQTLTKSKTPIPLRMLDYYVRLVRKHQLPVTQVVIFLQETNDGRAFTEEYTDAMTTHRYQVIRMWEQEPDFFLQDIALLPLAPLTKTDSATKLLSQIAESFATIGDKETRQNIATYTEIIAGLRFEKDLIHQLLTEDIMQESVIYQDILQKGEQRGEQRGLQIGEQRGLQIGEQRGLQIGEQRGLQVGEQQEAFQFLNRLLNKRFGAVDSVIIDRLRVLSKEELETLGERLFDFTQITDLETWLNQQNNHN